MPTVVRVSRVSRIANADSELLTELGSMAETDLEKGATPTELKLRSNSLCSRTGVGLPSTSKVRKARVMSVLILKMLVFIFPI